MEPVLTDEEKTRFARAYCASFNVAGLDVDTERFAAEGLTALDEMLTIPVEADEQRCQRYGIAGTTVADYREQLCDLGDGRKALLGIRFAAGDVSQPFVSAWPNYPLQSLADLAPLKAAAAKLFAAFSPQHLQVFAAAGTPFEQELSALVEPRQRLFLSPTAPLFSTECPWQLPDGYKLAQPNPESYYDRYLSLYRALQPLLQAANSQPNDQEDLAEALAQGLLWKLTKGDELVGMIQLEDQSVLGQKGLYICDVLVKPTHQGKALGSRMQVAVLQQLPRHYAFLWGEIMSSNIPSINSAQRIGRRPIRSEFLVPILPMHTHANE